MSWICPNCHREFKSAHQAHSCMVFTVDEHFKNRPAALKEAYESFKCAPLHV